MRRWILLAMVLGASALPGNAFGAGGSYAFDGGSAHDQAQVRAALDASAFDWGVVRNPVTIHIRRGVLSRSLPGHIWLDTALIRSGTFGWATIQDEYAHQIDFFLFNDAARQTLTRELRAKDWCYDVAGLRHSEYGCERFASTLVWAYWPSRDNAYRPLRPGDESAAMAPRRFRELVGRMLGLRDPFAIRR